MTEIPSHLAERNRLRELRAARLARLRPAARDAGDASDDAGTALEEFLRALTGGAPPPAPGPSPEARPELAAVLHFQRPERTPGSDLYRLPGAGPGLIWALGRAGIGCLADLAPLEASELAARLGPIGRLVPAQAWIDAARAAAP